MTSGAVAPTAAGGSANERSVDDVVVRNLFARVGVNLRVFDSVAGLFVDLVEADFLGIESGRSKRFGGHSFRHSIATNFPLARMFVVCSYLRYGAGLLYPLGACFDFSSGLF